MSNRDNQNISENCIQNNEELNQSFSFEIIDKIKAEKVSDNESNDDSIDEIINENIQQNCEINEENNEFIKSEKPIPEEYENTNYFI